MTPHAIATAALAVAILALVAVVGFWLGSAFGSLLAAMPR